MTSTPGNARIGELTAELERRILRRLALEWEDLNWSLFRSTLRTPQLRLLAAASRLGEWCAADRTIGISRHAVLEHAWLEVVEILKHEMAHQFVDEILGGEEHPHGPRFVRVCQDRGIDPAATGMPAAPTEAQAEDRVIARVRKLLALAESSNQHEAELAASTAQRLILKFNLDLQSRARTGDEAFRFAWVGVPTGRVQAHQRYLGALLIEHFFVKGVWVSAYLPETDKVGSVLEICGRPENVQMAEFVHDFLSRTIERLWVEHKKAQGMTSNRDRRAFLTGAVAGFGAKLEEKRRDARREGLVWVGDAGVREYVHRRHPRLHSVRSSAQDHREAYAHGQSAGRSIVLSRPMTSSTDDASPRRALPRGRE
jgi:hypothetical protein